MQRQYSFPSAGFQTTYEELKLVETPCVAPSFRFQTTHEELKHDSNLYTLRTV